MFNLNTSLAAAQISALTALYSVADETSAVTVELLSIIAAGMAAGKQVHDANIVATCRAYGISRLLTCNIADFARYASLVTIEAI